MLILLDIETLLDSADMGQANLAEDVAAEQTELLHVPVTKPFSSLRRCR